MIEIYIFSETSRERRTERIREVLNRHFGSEAAAIQLLKSDLGQPYLSNGMYVSITDSRQFWMLAVSDKPVGMDLQFHETGKREISEDTAGRCIKLSKRFLHPEEHAYVMEQPHVPEITTRHFFEIWTAKEAYVKYTGTGIDETFSHWSVLDEKFSGMIQYISFHPDYTLCICSETKEHVTLHHIGRGGVDDA